MCFVVFPPWGAAIGQECSGLQTLSYIMPQADRTPATLQQFVDSWRHAMNDRKEPCGRQSDAARSDPEEAPADAWVIGSCSALRKNASRRNI
jgi:hypothetical protein